MPIYRRGAIYWWRRNVPLRLPGAHPITLRLSLRTASAVDAKARAAALELKWDKVETVVQVALRPDLSIEDLRRVYAQAFKTELDRIVLRQIELPMIDAHAQVNTDYARYFTMLARCAHPPHPERDTAEQLAREGLSAQDAERLAAVVARHAEHLPITPNQIGVYLAEAGVYANERNRKAVGRLVAAAYRNACLEGSKLLGRSIEPEAIWPLPGNMLAMLGIEQQPQAIAPAEQPPCPEPSLTSSKPDGGLTTTAVAARAVAVRTESGDWDGERRRDVDAAVKLFVAANGDIPFATWQQHHLAATAALFPRLPTRYGFACKDPVTGELTQESIEDALARGARLQEAWRNDPVRAERDRLPTVGLGSVTRLKHLTWLSALVTFAVESGINAPEGLNFGASRRAQRKMKSSMGKKNTALSAWDAADLRHLLTAPIWAGCDGLWDRFSPGNEIFHDGFHWGPLILVLHGCRSDEGAGLMLDDVFDQAPVPFFHFRANGLRRIKTAASDRRVPINGRLLELGFLDYVRALRALGHTALFPEFVHPTLGFDHIFYDKVFEPLRATMFPDGTSRMRGRKDVDVRSIWSRCISHLRDVEAPKELRQAIVGHEVGDVTSDIYEKDPDPALLQVWVDKLGDLVPPIAAHPLRLRPSEWLRFGAPRGRPKKRVRT